MANGLTFSLKKKNCLAVLGLHYCMRAFSSCGKQGLLPSCGVQVSHCGVFSCFGTWALEYRLSNCGSRA